MDLSHTTTSSLPPRSVNPPISPVELPGQRKSEGADASQFQHPAWSLDTISCVKQGDSRKGKSDRFIPAIAGFSDPNRRPADDTATGTVQQRQQDSVSVAEERLCPATAGLRARLPDRRPLN